MHNLVKQQDNNTVRHAVANLIKLGADIEARDNEGYSVLHTATKHAQIPLIKLVLNNGADMESKNDAGWTPLMTACCRKFVEGIAYLLDRGADVDATVERSATGDTALNIAARSASPSVVTALLHHGADQMRVKDVAHGKCKTILQKWMSSTHS